MTFRERILERLREDAIGPLDPEESLSSYPSDVYLTGILYPQKTTAAPEEAEGLSAEGSWGGEEQDTSTDAIAHARLQRPASFGISFAVESISGTPELEISFAAGRYRLECSEEERGSLDGADPDEGAEAAKGDELPGAQEDPGPQLLWKRSPVSVEPVRILLDRSIQTVALPEANLRLTIRSIGWDSKWLVTVSAVNTCEHGAGDGRAAMEEACMFQTDLSVRCVPGSARFHRRPVTWRAADDDTRSAELIYRNAAEFAVGHTSSATWEVDEEGEIERVKTAWLVESLVPGMSASGDPAFKACVRDGADPYSASWLAEASGSSLREGLAAFVGCYETWVQSQADRIPALPEGVRAQARLHITRGQRVISRMKGSITALEKSGSAEAAFRLANQAMLMQRRWANPDEDDLKWRPFQLAFLLLSMVSLAERRHPDREVADLIWFPTGGGKTEAYLGLIAFVLFHRRLVDGAAGAGVSVIMRYTLRLLTIQQFERAAALISACERLRLGEGLPRGISVDLGITPFSIGLWVGRDSTPNRVQEAVAALRDDSPSTPRQLTTCPCEKSVRLRWSRYRDPDSIRATCSDPSCCWGSPETPLPVWTVDEDIYREQPSLVIGTIDKFAQIVRNPDTASLFGLIGDRMPPDLIIQDELHLISGPLGTVAGIYEAAVDELCTREGVRPKIIASTATIREADAQIRALFNRATCLFPPPMIDAENSGFAVIDQAMPGRLYAGVTTAGRSAKYTLQAISASVLQAVSEALESGEQEADWYATLVAYFNSLRELGGALVLMQDDVERSLIELAERRAEKTRELSEVAELTSRVSSAEVREILDQLEVPHGKPGTVDVLLASNMISVGVDISRLGAMIVNGQPKGMAEYIQATSRVGRGRVPGLVVSISNDAKTRDRSRYETFRTWHSTLYRDVEATSVTPFSSRSRDRSLHAALVALVRHTVRGMREGPALDARTVTTVEALAKRIVTRAREVDPDEADAVKTELDEIVARWRERAGLTKYWNDRQVNTSLLISAEEAAKRRETGRSAGQAWPTPNSMRNVEPSVQFCWVKRLRDSEDA